MKAFILGAMAVGAFAAGASVAAVRPATHHAVVRHHLHEDCVVRHGQRVCRMVR